MYSYQIIPDKRTVLGFVLLQSTALIRFTFFAIRGFVGFDAMLFYGVHFDEEPYDYESISNTSTGRAA